MTVASPVKPPGPWRWLRYALGWRLPAEYHDWVLRDLTGAGWRLRILVRHVATLLPVCPAAALLPGEWWIRVMTAAMVLLGSVFTVAVSVRELRRSRLHRHGFDPDLWSGR